ncbi:hypothetical protein, partial [Pseudomonas urmiensis]|uniref:hypothetical protein n=1 Tax=Pseudomonas urmiensis TaxID=2745493 RepID=UPI0034D43D6F
MTRRKGGRVPKYHHREWIITQNTLNQTNQEIRKSGNQEIRKSGNQEIRKSATTPSKQHHLNPIPTRLFSRINPSIRPQQQSISPL